MMSHERVASVSNIASSQFACSAANVDVVTGGIEHPVIACYMCRFTLVMLNKVNAPFPGSS